MECILRFCNYAKQAVFSITSLGKQDIILGYTWLHLHNLDIDWSTREVKMSQCPHHCPTCTEEARLEHCACAQERASVQSCQWGSLPYPDLDLVDPLPLAFHCKEAPYKDACRDREDPKREQTGSSSLPGTLEPDTPDKVIEEGDQILAALPP